MTEAVKDDKQNHTNSSPSKRKQHKMDKSNSSEMNKTWWVQIRLFPIWLRILLVIAIMSGAAVAGLLVGYGYIGDGEAKNVLEWSTWQHILDILTGKE